MKEQVKTISLDNKILVINPENRMKVNTYMKSVAQVKDFLELSWIFFQSGPILSEVHPRVLGTLRWGDALGPSP
jgi:hypothetical protein